MTGVGTESILLSGAAHKNCTGASVGGPFYNFDMGVDNHPTANSALSNVLSLALQFHLPVVLNYITPTHVR